MCNGVTLKKKKGVFIMNEMAEYTDELVNGLLRVLKDQVNRIIIYGSTVRGEATSDSDVDIAVIINGEMNAETEDSLSDFIVDINLKFDKVFSVIDIENQLFQKLENISPFYKNVNKEGIVLWKAA